MAGGNTKFVGHIDSKFGISIHQIPLLLRIIKTLILKLMEFTCILEVIY